MTYRNYFGSFDSKGRLYNVSGKRPATVLTVPYFDRGANKLRRYNMVLLAWCEKTQRAWYAPEGEGEVPEVVTWAA